MIKTFRTIACLLCGVSCTSAAILTEPRPSGVRTPTVAVKYDVQATDGSPIVDIDISDIFSFDEFGAIPPNETRVVDVGTMLGNPGGQYRVTGLGWDVALDAYIPSWLSDSSIALGDDPTYAVAGLVLVPGLGSDFPSLGIVEFQSNGIVDLTNVPGQGDVSFPLSAGNLYLQFFESYVDFGGGIPDAQWQPGSMISVQVMPVPEGSGLASVIVAAALMLRAAMSAAH